MFPRDWLLIFAIVILAAGCGAHNVDGVLKEPGKRQRPTNDGLDALDAIARLVKLDDIETAHHEIKQYLLRKPNDSRALAIAANIAYAKTLVDEAVELLDAAAVASPADDRIYRASAAILLAKSERWLESTSRFEALVIEYPDFNEARHSLTEILNARGFRFDANEHVRELCRRGVATESELRGLIFPSRAFANFREKPRFDDPDAVSRAGVMSVARALFSEGDMRDSLEVLQRSNLFQANNPCVVAFYGQVLLESQQFDEFETWVQQVPPGCQRYPSYWMALGGWALYKQKHRVAVRMYSEAILREPGDSAANFRMAQSLRALGKATESSKFAERAKSIQIMEQLTREALSSPESFRVAIPKLANRLAEAGRPLESLGWYGSLLDRSNAPSHAKELLAQKYLQTNHFGHSNFQDSRLCGLELADYPLDHSWLGNTEKTSETKQLPAKQVDQNALSPGFVNVAPDVDLVFQYKNASSAVEKDFLIFQSHGACVACLDYNLDGLVDIYFGQGASDPPYGLSALPNELFRNNGTRFSSVTDAAHCDDRRYSLGVTVGDWNQDGFPDLVIGNIQQNELLINQGDGTFCSQPGGETWSTATYTTGLAMGDINNDNLPDIVEVNYLDDPSIYDAIEFSSNGKPLKLPGPLQFRPAYDRLFISKGDGAMEGSALGGKTASRSTGLGVVLANFDKASPNEAFIANDMMANQFWAYSEEKNDVSWNDIATTSGLAYGPGGMPLACMGIAVADFDNNGRQDLHITNFAGQWSNHFSQLEDGIFVDQALPMGLDVDSLEMLGFGAQAIDYDNDSNVDLIVGNGHIDDFSDEGMLFEMPTQIFANRNGRFEQMQVAGDPEYWTSRHLSRALAKCDWNNDGQMDVVVTDLKQHASLLENQTKSPYHCLQLALVGTTAERDAIGATVEISFGGAKTTATVTSGDGYMCKNQSILSFGLGDSDHADQVTIYWPDGQEQILPELKGDRCWIIVQNEPSPFESKLFLSKGR
ncbi:tetratricopeptide (TPR) repeat protein [Rhodopirellula rubra]|uniref:Tetratricopeptide (TPR) repeat protein n=1 Tax=Aporhodopirellula rubra TaxID=980271 RepID=A0A7W5HA10_9BACT|nr:FG-GAP-like repeat-containing protein [Aporhodopirellula rubra]MBB3210670.1 tetratricopeptide (TPR) repeat protein [Aporhodopirellula rubra]